ncbi:tubulin/FtsZ family protein [Methanoplanus endosymbiosus]|uniref:Tubulin/FtsZ family protein n=1 Tax=Methanoplanus endosymbiosus TaxID=33865 RepID=A0A9E7PQN5_9EURY|nr:tubulin/FtsZ family protein [Methanoplanus endosymbiosus]UUX91717.1 tubulin/FtsZ family protein [Methanoplanus endosymbiosus]
MKILAVGLGGAGSRIVDQLYYQDRRSSVSCISSVVIDVDGNLLNQLKNLPNDCKIFFPAIDPDVHYDTRSTVDIKEIMAQIKKLDNLDIDAILVFTGLGGSLSDIIPEITEEIRKAYYEPVFAVCTLPYHNEGKRIAAKAADDIKKIEKFVDGIILFDNETWYRKIKASYETSVDDEGKSHIRQAAYAKIFPDNPRDLYKLLNDKISRQIGLLLRAGEFNESGVEYAEVVLDAGEVLNTLKDNGITAIGYAIEELPRNRFDPLQKLRPESYFSDGSHKRATRIVSLAKKAVYEEISIPCDLTSAYKALILIAGPSKELSMKGFQTVRKWIDSSIAGLEMRSGDYPVRSTKYVGIIIMLSGIQNIPRLEEIKQLSEEYKEETEQREREYAESRILMDEEINLLLNSDNAGTEDSEDESCQEESFDLYEISNRSKTEQDDDIPHNEETDDEEYYKGDPDDDVWELIDGGFSSKPPETINDEEIHPPIIEAEEVIKDMSYVNENNESDYTESLNIVEFFEDKNINLIQIVEEEDNNGCTRGYSFNELLEDDEPERYEEERSRSYEPENYPLTSIDYVKREEYEELKKELSRYREDSIKKGSSSDKSEINNKDNRIKVKNNKKRENTEDSGISLPGRADKNIADMTRMTDVSLGKAPKDRIFEVGGIKGPQMPREKSDVARVGEKISIGSTAFKANDRSFSTGNFSAGSKQRPSENSFGGGNLSAGSKQRPSENSFGGGSLSAGSKQRPSENSFAGGSLSAGSKQRPNDSAFAGSVISVAKVKKANDNSISGRIISVRQNIVPKDSGNFKVGSKIKKPKELLSDGVKIGSNTRPKELLSDNMRLSGGIKKPKELLSGGVKIGSNPGPKELLSGGVKIRGEISGRNERNTRKNDNINGNIFDQETSGSKRENNLEEINTEQKSNNNRKKEETGKNKGNRSDISWI